MFYRRKLPHWHPDISEATFLFVTWRLAGSMPRSRVLQLAGESACPTTTTSAATTTRTSSAGRAFLAFDREVDKAAFGPVWLRDDRVARVVADALLYGESGRHFYRLRAWVVMPNHVHVLLRPMTSMPVITRWVKGSTARQANLILGRTGEPFWQDESFDHRVRDEVELGRIVRYVEHNPVSAGLARNPREWAWSSAQLAGGAPSGSACPTTGANPCQI
jgi:REP element-mobilizing transposase RayT